MLRRLGIAGGMPAAAFFVAVVVAVALSASGGECAGPPLRGELFVIDPGHGAKTPSGAWLNSGAAGPNQVAERDVVLAIGEDLAALVRRDGGRTVLTRSYAVPYRIASDKNADNRARAALANRLHATAFLALHADASLSRGARGTSVFWLRSNSLPLARAVRARLRALDLGEAAFRPRSLAVTRIAQVPAVLIELGFISNPVQERLLATPAFQEREARALLLALEDVFGRSAGG